MDIRLRRPEGPSSAETVKPHLYVQNYYSLWVNANGIIPKGVPVDFSAPHGREHLSERKVLAEAK